MAHNALFLCKPVIGGENESRFLEDEAYEYFKNAMRHKTAVVKPHTTNKMMCDNAQQLFSSAKVGLISYQRPFSQQRPISQQRVGPLLYLCLDFYVHLQVPGIRLQELVVHLLCSTGATPLHR